MNLGDRRFPTLHIDGDLYHVGTVNPAQKSRTSMEGQGLSVSICPDAWRGIAHLQGSTYRLTRLDHRFLDYPLTPVHHDSIRTWGHTTGYVTTQTLYQVSYTDDSGDDKVITYDSEDEAISECGEDVEVEAVPGWGGDRPSAPPTRPHL